MNVLTKLTDFVGGNLFKEVKEGIMEYFPPDLSPQQRSEIELRTVELLNQKEKEVNQILNEASSQLDKRVQEQEGTASDLKALPFVGRIVLFLRGLQRPVWGFATLYMDYKWFFDGNILTERQELAMIVINVLVLGFLFGERTIKNLQPLIEKVFAK